MFDALPNAFVFEIIQVVLAHIGLGAAILNLYDARKDQEAVRASKVNGRLGALAWRNVISAWFTVVAFCLSSAIGWAHLVFPPPPPFVYRVDTSSEAFVVLFGEIFVFAVTTVLLLQTVTKKLLRSKAMRAKIDAGYHVS